MRLSKAFSIREFGYLLDGGDSAGHVNAVAIPHSAFSRLLFSLHNDSADTELAPFLKLASYKQRPALQVQNYVGVLRTSCGTQVEVLPKLYNQAKKEPDPEDARAQLLRMLRALRNSPFKEGGQAEIRKAKLPLLETYIAQFLGTVNRLVKRGICSDYVEIRENARFLKGRLLVSQQVRRNTSHPERFQIQYNKYLLDRPANRLIKSCLFLVTKLTRDSRNQRRARELGLVFHEVPGSRDYKLDFQRVKTDRSMSHYRESLEWARLLLGGSGLAATDGDFSTISLLYPMERIFEDYVASCLRRHLNEYFPLADRLQTQARKLSLVEEHRGRPIFQLRPDLLVKSGKEILCVMDTKWKLLDSSGRAKKYGISQADMYQLYAYGHKYLKSSESKRLMLIYPKTDTFTAPLAPFRYEDGFSLQVVPFDITTGKLLLQDWT